MSGFLPNLLVGILSSIIATIIVFVTATKRSRTTRKALTAIASYFLKIDIKYVYDNSDEANRELQSEMKRSNTIRVFAGRGNEFQRDLYQPLYVANTNIKKVIKILLPDVNNQPRGTDWIDQREKELAIFDPAHGNGLLHNQVTLNNKFLNSYSLNGTLELKGYDLPHIGKIILTDDYVFLTPYNSNSHGRHTRVIQFGHGDMYDFFDRFFNMAWEDSK